MGARILCKSDVEGEPRQAREEGNRALWGYFGTSKNTPFWLFLAPPANPVEFFWFKMAGKGVPHIDTCSMLDSHL